MTSGYAGDLTPQESWEILASNPKALLVDVRTQAEWNFVGVPDTSDLGRARLSMSCAGPRASGDLWGAESRHVDSTQAFTRPREEP